MRGRILNLFFLVLVASPFVAAQIITGTIQGLVTDQSGAVIPGVGISVKNLDTNQVRTMITNETGNYVAPLLPVGRYEVTVELSGFQTQVKSGMELQVEQRLNLNFVLEVGNNTERIVVTESAPLVQADSSTVGSVVDTQKLVELPLNGRRFTQVGLLIPTATTIKTVSGDGGPQRDMFSVAGLPGRYNNYMIDGIDNNDNSVNMAAIKPSIESIREFKILSGTYSAEVGRGGGAQVNVITKSGTNELHGSAYEFFRDSALDAKNYFDKSDATIPPFYRHQFGFALGGPVVKNKTFFFVADEGLRLRQSLTRATQVPLPEMKRGDFSSLLQPNNIFGTAPIVIRDPFNNNAPFPGNVIPPTRFDPSGAAIANVYPDPNQAGRINFVSTPPDDWRWHQPSVRVDHLFSEKDTVFARANHNLLRSRNTFGRSGDLPGYGEKSRIHSDNIALVETHVFNAKLINEVRLGYNFFTEYYPSPNQGYDATELRFGIKGTSRAPRELGYPMFLVTPFTQVGDSSAIDRKDHTYQFYNGISWLKGSHALKFGGEIRNVRNNFYDLNNSRGTFSFNGRYTGFGLADVLLGIPTQTTVGLGDAQRYIRSTSLHLFVQDDWKVSRRLTLNLGVRYELNQVPYDKNNRISSFNSKTGQNEIAGVGGVRRGISKTDGNNYAPRVGLAYNLTPDGRTIIRAGYGIYYNQVAWATILTGSAHAPPWVEARQFNASTTFPDLTMRDPFPASLGKSSISYYSQDQDLRYPYIQQYSFGVQRQFGGNTVFELSYLGNKGTKQNINRAINQPAPGPGNAAAVNARRPFPAISNLSQLQTSSNMNYNAMIVRAEKRFSSGLTFLSSYTWGKAIHDQTTPDMRNNRLGRGPADIDNRHRVISSFLYALPFGTGKRLGSGQQIVNRFIGGWQIAGILTLRSGQAFTPTLTADVSNTTARTDRPNVIGKTRSSNPDPKNGWWNRDAFTLPDPFTFGNAGTGILVGPDFKNLDFSLQKVLKTTESKSLEFRTEFFNITNHPNFFAPNTQFDTPLFGRATQALDSRQVQLGLKFIF